MTQQTYLGELEQMVLWAVLRLDGDGYGTTILEALTGRVDRRVTPGALYATLDRLEEKGMIQSRLADPEAGRTGDTRIDGVAQRSVRGREFRG